MWADIWRRRGALMYTVGMWTVFGSIVYYSSGFLENRGQPAADIPAGNDTSTTISEDSLKETTVYRKPGSSFIVMSTTEYKPNFVPYSVRFNNYIQSFFDNSDSKGK